MSQATTDRNLLSGLLAFQMDFVTRDALTAAMNTWVLEKDKPLSKVLVSQGALPEDDDALLDSLVRRLMQRHDNDPRRSMAAVSTVAAILPDLEKIADQDLAFSLRMLAELGETTLPGNVAGRSHAAGAQRSGGSRFRLVEFHAKGGQGEVWIAEDTELHRQVALKRLQAYCADDRGSRLRFVHEAEVTGALEHRGIAPVYSRGNFDDGRPFYAMRFIGGTSLKDAIERFHLQGQSARSPDDHALELRRLLGQFVDVCNTVAYAHSRGVIHRDLKPGNIILDEFGETLVVDWGLAKSGCSDVEFPSSEPAGQPVSASELPSTIPGAKMGTPAFMSPEQAAGRTSDIGPSTDIYSLGATLYCLLTGMAPFDTKEPTILQQVCAGDFLRPRQILASVPAALEAICLKAMALDPASRYASARALGEEIERWLADQPVLAYPEPLPARAMRWIRRRKQWVAAAAALLLFTALGLAIHNGQIRREQARTTEQLGMTRDALRELLKVSGENLAFIPNTEKLRQYLAQLVLVRYQQLGEKFPSDPGIRLETALVFRVIGGIGRITGQFTESHGAYRKAIDELTSLCQNSPGQADYLRWLVETLIDRGELYHMNGLTTDAEHDFHEAAEQSDTLLGLPGPASDYRTAKASALINLSEILSLKNQHPEARMSADQAVELLKPLAGPSADPKRVSRNRWLLAMALTDRGMASREGGDETSAAGDFDEAARVASEIPGEDESYDDAQFQVASIANQRGEMLSKAPSKLTEAERNFEQAFQILSRLVSDHKLIAHYREELTVTLVGRASTRMAMNHVAEAERDFRAALDLISRLIDERKRRGAPEAPQYLSLLGQILARTSQIHIRQGRPADARTTLTQAAEHLSRAVQIDPARESDKVRLEQIRTSLARMEK